ncbi:MAG: (2Fe-2S) ferredoxin domain-containing protein [Deltaproteobacteria bacterium]|nr:(2Fe-2S) ferredoxin domain-containing protein [Deltaproteobacteria bacterium]
MKTQKPAFKKYIFVCENVRENGEICCGPHAMGDGYVKKLKDYVKKNGLSGVIRVSRSGCLDICAQGPNIVVYPEGRWYSQIKEEDLDKIIEKEIKPEIGNVK